MNNSTIRDLLHIPKYAQTWSDCSNIDYTNNKTASEWIYHLLKDKYRIMFYSGDTDGAVPTFGSQ